MNYIVKRAKSASIAAGKLLPAVARRTLFHFAFACAPDEFEKYAFLYANAPSQGNRLRWIAAKGFSPQTILDVGAYRGNWSRMAKAIWPKASIIMIEPNWEQNRQLVTCVSELGATLHRELLGAEDGKEVQFHVMATGSSVLAERSDVPRKTELRRLVTLNSLLASGPSIDFMKIDAQGYELSILEGADRILSNVKMILLEAALIEVNEGGPLLHDVISSMNARGFVAFDLLEMHRRPLDQALCQVDILFCRQDDPLRADKRFC